MEDDAAPPRPFEVVLADDGTSEEVMREKEAAVTRQIEAWVVEKNAAALGGLIARLRPFFAIIPKARTAKIVRSIIDHMGKIPDCTDLQVSLCNETVAWCTVEKRAFLRMRVQLKLSQLLLEQGKFPAALTSVAALLREVKRLDDKALLVELHLLESRTLHALRNGPKARAALTAARTAASSIYVGPELQADLDLQAGSLHAEERDYRTAFSYFYEVFEGRNSLGDAGAAVPLKYMLLCKVMLDQPDEVPALIGSKAGLKHAGPGLDAMRAVAAAYKDRSLLAFERALAAHSAHIAGDAFVARHLAHLADKLLEQNLLRLVAPFSCVQVEHIAGLIGLPPARVEAKLSQMVLDKALAGTLDQGTGTLHVYDGAGPDKGYAAALKAVAALSSVVDVLHKRSVALK